MKDELVYEIARFDPRSHTEELVERAHLVRRADALWYMLPDGSESRCDVQPVSAAIQRYPALHEVRPNQITRIAASDEAMHELPLALRLIGKADEFDRRLWSDTLWSEHVDNYNPEEYFFNEVLRAPYVNDHRWGTWPSADGQVLLPFDDQLEQPHIHPRWADISFTEYGSMTSGIDESWIGLVTPGVTAAFVKLDEELPGPVWLRSRRGGDARVLVEWLLEGGLSEPFFNCDPTGQKLFAQLFLAAAYGDYNGQGIPGSWLLDTREADTQFMIGATDSSGWNLSLNLEPGVVEEVCDLIAQQSSQLAEIVEAARAPDSAAGHRRRAYLEHWARHHEWDLPSDA
jgi:hypothetical protein